VTSPGPRWLPPGVLILAAKNFMIIGVSAVAGFVKKSLKRD